MAPLPETAVTEPRASRRGCIGAAYGIGSTVLIAGLSFLVLTLLANAATRSSTDVAPETLALLERRSVVWLLALPGFLVSLASIAVRGRRRAIGLSGVITLLALLPAGYAGWVAYRFLAPLYQFQEIG